MRTGNVVKFDGRIYIVTRVIEDSKRFELIPVDSTGSTTFIRERREVTYTCYCYHEYGELSPECEDCKGTGEIRVEESGIEDIEIIASNVYEYIVKSLLKGFDLKLKYF